MKYVDFEMEDFVLDNSFQNYCLGNNHEDVVFWEDWIKRHPGKAEIFRLAKEVYISLNGNHNAEQFNADRIEFAKIAASHLSETSLNSPAEPIKLTNHAPLRKIALYGSVAAAIILGAFYFTKFGNFISTKSGLKHLPADQITKVSKQGERKSFQLPDGSIVMLNAESEIHIDKNFNTRTRELTLEGEAYFDVAHDASRPFIIHTNNMDVKVLGTIFNVKAYPGDKTTETSLIKGSVEISLHSKETGKILLHPNEKIVIPNTTDHIVTKNTDHIDIKPNATENSNKAEYKITGLTYNKNNDAITEVSWTKNRLAFNNCSFETIAKDLERWYNVKISFRSEEVKAYKFTATFDQKNIERVLEALQLSRYFNYTITNNNNITISE